MNLGDAAEGGVSLPLGSLGFGLWASGSTSVRFTRLPPATQGITHPCITQSIHHVLSVGAFWDSGCLLRYLSGGVGDLVDGYPGFH